MKHNYKVGRKFFFVFTRWALCLLIFNQSVDVMLSSVFGRRHFENVGDAQKRLLSLAIRDHLQKIHFEPKVFRLRISLLTCRMVKFSNTLFIMYFSGRCFNLWIKLIIYSHIGERWILYTYLKFEIKNRFSDTFDRSRSELSPKLTFHFQISRIPFRVFPRLASRSCKLSSNIECSSRRRTRTSWSRRKTSCCSGLRSGRWRWRRRWRYRAPDSYWDRPRIWRGRTRLSAPFRTTPSSRPSSPGIYPVNTGVLISSFIYTGVLIRLLPEFAWRRWARERDRRRKSDRRCERKGAYWRCHFRFRFLSDFLRRNSVLPVAAPRRMRWIR